MRFEPKLDVVEIPAIMRRISKIAPHGYWAKRLRSLDQEEKKNSLLSDYFDQELPIERSYGIIHRYHRITGQYPDIDDRNYVLYTFLTTLALVYEGLTEKGQSRLCGMVRDGLQDKKGLSSLATELRTAAHLMERGFDVQFSDLENAARFDFLVSRRDWKIEIDCKAASGDVGRQIHGRRFRSLANELMPVLHELVEARGGHLLKILLHGGLHGDIEFERSLSEEVGRTLKNGSTEASTKEFSLSLTSFQLNDSPFTTSPRVPQAEVAGFLSRRFGLENVNSASRWSPGRGAAILVVQSEKPDRVLDGIYRQLKDSASKQFSRARPAVLCVQLRDITEGQLRNIKAEPNNGLRGVAARLFSGDDRDHLAGVSFLATAGVTTESGYISDGMMHTTLQDVGAAFFFRNPKNSSGDAMSALFGGRGDSGA